MKSFQILAAMLLGSMSSFAGNPVAATSLNVKVGIPTGYNGVLNFEQLENPRLTAYKSETIFLKMDKPMAAFSRSLNAGTQILLVNNCPVLVNAGDQIQMVLSPKLKDGKVFTFRFSPSFTGKDAARQALPHQIDSLYTAEESISTVEGMDAFIKNSAQQVQAMITRAKITGKENLALLNAYEQTKLMRLKYAFQYTHKALLPSKAYGDWCLNGFDITSAAFSGISSDTYMQETLNLWWELRKMQDSVLKNEFKLVEVMTQSKSELVKGSLASKEIKIESVRHNWSPRLKQIFSIVSGNLAKDNPYKQVVDSMHTWYSRLEPGTPAFNFALKNDLGDIVRLADFKGKVVIIDCWATWCTSCVAGLPSYNRIRESYKDKKDIVFLTIGWEGEGAEEAWKEFSKKKEINGATNLILSLDRADEQCKQMVERFCMTGVPRWIAINEEGKLLDGDMGHPGDPQLEQKIANYYKMKN